MLILYYEDVFFQFSAPWQDSLLHQFVLASRSSIMAYATATIPPWLRDSQARLRYTTDMTTNQLLGGPPTDRHRTGQRAGGLSQARLARSRLADSPIEWFDPMSDPQMEVGRTRPLSSRSMGSSRPVAESPLRRAISVRHFPMPL